MVRDVPTVCLPMLAPGVRPPFVVGPWAVGLKCFVQAPTLSQRQNVFEAPWRPEIGTSRYTSQGAQTRGGEETPKDAVGRKRKGSISIALKRPCKHNSQHGCGTHGRVTNMDRAGLSCLWWPPAIIHHSSTTQLQESGPKVLASSILATLRYLLLGIWMSGLATERRDPTSFLRIGLVTNASKSQCSEMCVLRHAYPMDGLGRIGIGVWPRSMSFSEDRIAMDDQPSVGRLRGRSAQLGLIITVSSSVGYCLPVIRKPAVLLAPPTRLLGIPAAAGIPGFRGQESPATNADDIGADKPRPLNPDCSAPVRSRVVGLGGWYVN